MKGTTYLIGIAIFVLTGFLFLSEYGKFYENFTVVNNDTTRGVAAGAGAAGAGTNTATAPVTTTTSTVSTEPSTANAQAPGTTTSPSADTRPTNAEVSEYVRGLTMLYMTITQKGGSQALKGMLSNADKPYFQTLLDEIGKMNSYTQNPGSISFTSDKLALKIQEVNYANQYLSQFSSSSGTSILKQTVEDKLLVISNPTESLPLPSQFTSNGISMSSILANMTTDPTKPFADGKSESSKLTASDLQELILRTENITRTLTSLNSREPVIVARIQNLEKLILDLREIKDSITRGTISQDDVPITVGDARSFLKSTIEIERQLPNLINGGGSENNHDAQGQGQAQQTQGRRQRQTQEHNQAKPPMDLLDMARFLKWNISVTFDADLYAREEMARRVDRVIQLLESKKISSSEAERILETLTSIQGQIVPNKHLKHNAFKSEPETVNTGNRSRPEGQGYIPGDDQLIRVSDGGFSDVSAGSESYLTRASGAYSAYEYAATTSPDHKERLINLCGQITRSGLGTGEELGCPKDINQASMEYGFKGTYLMVCNRLKDTWGGAYPEMFGCPKQDRTSRF